MILIRILVLFNLTLVGFTLLLVLATEVSACDQLNYVDELAQENVETLDACIGDVQRLNIETVECEYAARLPEFIWEKVNATDCALTKQQKANLLNVNSALDAYKQVLAQGDVK